MRSTTAPVQGTSQGAASEQLAGAFSRWAYFDGGASEIHTVKRGSTEALTARFLAKGRDLQHLPAYRCPVPHKNSS